MDEATSSTLRFLALGPNLEDTIAKRGLEILYAKDAPWVFDRGRTHGNLDEITRTCWEATSARFWMLYGKSCHMSGRRFRCDNSCLRVVLNVQGHQKKGTT